MARGRLDRNQRLDRAGFVTVAVLLLPQSLPGMFSVVTLPNIRDIVEAFLSVPSFETTYFTKVGKADFFSDTRNPSRDESRAARAALTDTLFSGWNFDAATSV